MVRIKIRTKDEYLRIYKKVVDRVKYSLSDWDFEDIIRASQGGAKRGAFILGSCFIDHLSCYYSGNESDKKNYSNFINKYLPSYDGDDLWTDMRCKLVHNYSLGNKYSIIHHHSKFHLKKDSDRRLIINLRNFVNDLCVAKDKYFTELENDEQLQINFAKWYISGGILVPVESDVSKKNLKS